MMSEHSKYTSNCLMVSIPHIDPIGQAVLSLAVGNNQLVAKMQSQLKNRKSFIKFCER